MQNGDAGVQRRREDLEAGMEAGVTVAPSAAHGRLGVRRRLYDPEAGMEAGVAIVRPRVTAYRRGVRGDRRDVRGRQAVQHHVLQQ